MADATGAEATSPANLGRIYGIYTGGFIAFIILMAILERARRAEPRHRLYVHGLHHRHLRRDRHLSAAPCRSANTMSPDAACRRSTTAWRRAPTGCRRPPSSAWPASLYLLGYDGLAFVLGWTGGYVLVAILVAPYLRKFGAYTVPDFLSARYGGNLARFIGVVVLFSCSFTYVVAQIFGTGIISARFLGIDFNVAVYVGLAGILVCSMLGGMRAVTWTQVAQYIVLIIAYLIPAIWMSTVKTGIPIPQLMQGQALQEHHRAGERLRASPSATSRRSRMAATTRSTSSCSSSA